MSDIGRWITETVKCVVCGAGYGQCDCWSKCANCGWSFRKGKVCRHCSGDNRLEVIALKKGRKKR